MLSTTGLISDLNEVPNAWIFENYLKLSEKLCGQDIKISSIFRTEKTPSFCIYYDKVSTKYRFKDFSSGKQGDAIDLVVFCFNYPSRGDAVKRIISDYSEYVKDNNIEVVHYQETSRYKVTDYEVRHWNTLDQKYWTEFSINSSLLSKFNVQPLAYYQLSKDLEDGTVKHLKFDKPFVYGYFKEDGTLYKIYQPKTKSNKFIKLQSYIQGSEQLKFDTKYLLITSSLKDIMAFSTLGIMNIEVIAPDSENTFISEADIKKYQKQYSKIVVIFDNDEPGIEAAKNYNQRYGLNYAVLPFEKDIADTVAARGVHGTRDIVFTLLKNIL
jgi:hypothetical protein